MKFFHVQIIICILFSIQQNLTNKNINNNEEEKFPIGQNDIKNINLEEAVSNISKLFNDKIYNMNMQINNLINNTLNTQGQLLNNSELEQQEIKEMLKEINKLKKRYKRNLIFSYAICSIILFTFFIFYCTDNLNNRNRKNLTGYKNPVQIKNENTQLDIV